MFSTFLVQLLVGMLTMLLLLSLFFLGASQRVKTGASHGERSPLAKWLLAHPRAVTSISWAVAMYMAMAVTPAVAEVLSGKSLNVTELLIGIPIWTLAGLFFAWPISLWPVKHRKTSADGNGPGAKI